MLHIEKNHLSLVDYDFTAKATFTITGWIEGNISVNITIISETPEGNCCRCIIIGCIEEGISKKVVT